MNICGKGNFPECQFFTTGGCMSSSNCIYKIEQDFYTRAISNAMEISKNAEIARLTTANAELCHRAEVAERALLTACVNLIKDEKDNVNMELLARVVYTKALRKARKEVEEEKNEQV